MLVYNWSWSWK